MRRLVRQLFRPRYLAGPMVVHPKRWWWPPARKRARLAAQVVEHMAAHTQVDVVAAVTDWIVYGAPPEWMPDL